MKLIEHNFVKLRTASQQQNPHPKKPQCVKYNEVIAKLLCECAEQAMILRGPTLDLLPFLQSHSGKGSDFSPSPLLITLYFLVVGL